MNIIEEIRAFREIVLGKQDKLIPGDHIILGDDDVISVDFAPVDALLDRLEEVEDDINTLNFDVTELDIRLDAAEENIEDAQDHLDSVDYSINELNESLDALETKVDNIHGFEIVALSEGQYDPETMKPTIENPKTNTLYLVPNDDPTQRNLWIEWLWISNRWEQFGTAVIDLSEYVKKTDTPTAILPGVVKVNRLNGVQLLSNGQLAITPANLGDIQSGQAEYLPITPVQQHNAVFYGLARASRTPALYYNAVDKTNIRLMIDAGSHAQVENLANDVEGFGIKVDQLLNRTGETRPGMVWESKIDGAGWSEAAQGRVVDVTKDGESLMDKYGIVELPDINVPTKTSDLVNDSGFITESSLPTKVSDLENDSGFLVSADLVNYALRSEIPTKVSDLQNDSGFLTEVPLASKTFVGGMKISNDYWTKLSTTGILYAEEKTYSQYQAVIGSYNFISKGTLENVLNGRGYPVDVQINGTSIVDENKIANIPYATYNSYGVVRPSDTSFYMPSNGYLYINSVPETDFPYRNGASFAYKALTMNRLDYAVKAALTDGVGPAYTSEEQAAARERLGITAGEKEIFEATYGVTTYDEITEALEAGKLPIVYYNKFTYTFSYDNDVDASSEAYEFQSVNAIMHRGIFVRKNDDSWHYVEITMQQKNLVTTVSGYKASNTKYPSTKAVVDYTDNRFLGAGINNVEEVELLNGTFSFHAETEEEGLDEDGNPKWYLTDAITDITRNDIIWGQQYKLVVDGVEYRLYGEQHSSDYNHSSGFHDCMSIGDANVLGYVRETGCEYIIAYRFKNDTNINIYTTSTLSSHTIKLYKVNIDYDTLPNELYNKKQGITIIKHGTDNRYSIALGNSSNATNDGSLAEGILTTASGSGSHSEGGKTIASGKSSHSEGASTIASGNSSHSEGASTIANGTGSHAEGGSTRAFGGYSHAEGTDTMSVSSGTHSEGCGTIAGSQYSHSEGWDTRAFGVASHAEGTDGVTFGAYAHAEGAFTKALGQASHSGGIHTIATRKGSNVIGEYNIADTFYDELITSNNNRIFFLGDGTTTTFTIDSSMWFVNTIRSISVVENGETKPIDYTLSGNNIIFSEAPSNKAIITIIYNGCGSDTRGKYAHIVGNGTADNARSNAHTLDWNGLGWFKGGLKVGGTGQDDSNAENVVLESDLSSYALESDLEALEDKVDALHGFEIVFLTTGEYDPETGIPTILGPQEGTLYLVPSGESAPNLWIEWLWTGEAWEKFGSASIDLSNYVQKTDYATSTVGGVIIADANYGAKMTSNGKISAVERTYDVYQQANNNLIIGKGTLENILAGRGYLTEVPIATGNNVGGFKTSSTFGTGVSQSNGKLYATVVNYSDYDTSDTNMFISKGTLENVLTGRGYPVDVMVNGTSVVDGNKVANIPIPSISYDETEEMLVWQTTADDGNEVSY